MTNLKKLSELFFTVLLVLLSIQTVKSQAIIKLRSTLSTGGSSKTFTTDNGQQYYLQQSIGQSGVIGLSQDQNYLLRQGFIQPPEGSVTGISLETLQAKVFPNPFSAHITVLFTEEISDILYVRLFELNGKIVYFNKYEPGQELNLNVGYLSPSIYFIKVNTVKKCFYLKMVKLQTF